MDALKSHLIRLLGALLCLVLISACSSDSETAQELDQVVDQLGESFSEQADKLSDLIPNTDGIQKTSQEQIRRTFAIEYKTVDVGTDIKAEQLQKTLEELGKDRWDCFAVIPSFEGQRILCKRPTISALRALVNAKGLLW